MGQEELIRELTERIITHIYPASIMLFGSASKGEDSPDSDIDILVIGNEGGNVVQPGVVFKTTPDNRKY